MKLGASPRQALPPRPGHGARLAACLFALLAAAAAAQGGTPVAATAAAATTMPTEEGASWHSLNASQREALAPLQQEWPRMDPLSKRKWLALAERFPTMPAAERARIQTRMSDWAALTPKQRGKARLHFQEARRLPKIDREAKWQAYQALPAEQKKQLAARAASARHSRASAPDSGGTRRIERLARDAQPKSSRIAEPVLAPPLRSVAPTLVQVSPGATTTAVSERPAPPLREQKGMPKIAATPEFIDPLTLLPRRGPQATAPAFDAEPARRP